jgi:hypothetical protein
MLMYVAREAPLQRVKLVYPPPSSRAQRKGRDQCGARYEISLLELEIAKTFGWLIVSAMVVLIAGIIVSALF